MNLLVIREDLCMYHVLAKGSRVPPNLFERALDVARSTQSFRESRLGRLCFPSGTDNADMLYARISGQCHPSKQDDVASGQSTV